MRREIPLLITFIVGTALVVALFIPHHPFPELDGEFSIWFDIIAVFAFILGGGNLLKVHIDRIQRRHRDRFFSAVTIVGFLGTLIIGLLKFGGSPGLKGNYIADSNAASVYTVADIKDPEALVRKVNAGHDPVSQYLKGNLSASTLEMADRIEGGASMPDPARTQFIDELAKALVEDLNVVLTGGSIFDERRFAGVKLDRETRAMIANPGAGHEEGIRLNRRLLQSAYPDEINPSHGTTWFRVIYNGIFVPLGATMFSLLAFFVASASYRAFRAKTREATVLLIAAFIILIGRTPLGYYLTFWLPEPLQFLHIPNLSAWILSAPNLAGQRAIMIGIALGIIATSLKLILGIERGYLGHEK